MCHLFDIKENQVIVCDLNGLEKITVSDDIVCLCVMSNLYGDIKTLLSLYIIKMDLELFIQKLIGVSHLFKDTFFIAYDNFNGYLKIHNNTASQVKIDERYSDDGFMYFLK